MRTFQRLLFLFPLTAAACTDVSSDADQATQGLAESTDGDHVYPDTDNVRVCKPLVVRGKLFYNDLRGNGRFALRKRTDGITDGSRERFQSNPDASNPSRDNENYLALRDARVSIYEIDSTPSSAGCFGSEYQGSVQVAPDGSWSWSGNVCDACSADGEGASDNGVSVAAKVSLERCDNPDARCFSVRDPGATTAPAHFDDAWDGAVWSRWIRGASSSAPVVVHTQPSVDTGTDYFQASGSQTAAVLTDLHAQAANVFASLADVTRKVHLDEDVPFVPSTDDEVKAFFPSTGAGTHSHEDGRMCVSASGATGTAPRTPTTWENGWSPVHEYGHLVHYWNWESHGKWTSFCFDDDGDGVGDCEESVSQKEFALAAFKEGWAQFIGHVTFDQTGSDRGCNTIERRAPRGCSATGLCPTGRHFIDDAAQVLCDLWDTAGETTTHDGIVMTDTRSDSLRTLWNTLGDVWQNTSEANRDDLEDASRHQQFEATAPLGICELAQQRVDNGASEVGIETALAQTSLDCNLD